MEDKIWRNRWWVVVASAMSLTVGAGSILLYASGVFIKPVSQELGIGRGVFSSAISLANIVQGLATPFFGRMLDRYGCRRALLPCILLFALLTASLAFMTPSLAFLMMLFALQGLFSTSQTPAGYSKMITSRFDRRRGLALGIALTGSGWGLILIPQFCRVLLQHFGWRGGYIGLGCVVLIFAFIPVALFFGETPEIKQAREMLAQNKAASSDLLPGMTFSAGVRTSTFWAISAAIFLGIAVVNGMLMQLVPLLTDRGFPISKATGMMGFAGISLITGRVLAGYLVDRIFASYIAIFFLILPMIGVAIFASGFAGIWIVIGTILLGLSVGAEFDLLAFITGRYFGVRAFGALYGLGLLWASFANATGTGLMGWCYQLKHSYAPMFIVFEVMLVVAIILMARLGPYRYPAPARAPNKGAAAGAGR